MKIINETRVMPLRTRAGTSVEVRERVVGFDARWAGRGVVYERHVPFEVVTTTGYDTQTVPITSAGPIQRLWPFIISPAAAVIVKVVFRAKG